MSVPDDQIEALFADLRAEEMGRAPRFSVLWTAGGQTVPGVARPSRISRAGWSAAAATIVIAVTLLARHLWHDQARGGAPLPDSASYPSIESWSAPTDALLRHAQVATAPPPGALGSVLDDLATDLHSSNPYK